MGLDDLEGGVGLRLLSRRRYSGEDRLFRLLGRRLSDSLDMTLSSSSSEYSGFLRALRLSAPVTLRPAGGGGIGATAGLTGMSRRSEPAASLRSSEAVGVTVLASLVCMGSTCTCIGRGGVTAPMASLRV